MRRFVRLGAFVASTTLAVSGLTAIAPTAHAAPGPDPSGKNSGVAWLKKQLTNGIVHNTQFNFDDYGLTIDVGLALKAVGGQAGTVLAIAAAMADGAHDNYYTSTFNGTTTTYAGSLAKLALLVQSSDSDTSTYGDEDLIALLEGRVAASAPIAGRVQDQNNSFGDTNTLGQAYAVAALHNAGSSKESSALSFLLSQQCPNGGFRLTFNSSTTSSSQSCTDNTQAQIDATSVALIELKSLGSSASPVTSAITNATSFLVGKQQSSGAWGGDPGGSAENSNATGLAAWALGNTAQSAKGAGWLRDHQATYYDYCTKLKNDVGTVAYDAAALSAGRSGGITTGSQDQFRRAAAQAVVGLQYLQSETVNKSLTIDGPPSGFLKAGSFQTFRVTGGVTGEELCLTSLNASSGSTVGATSPWTRSLYMPTGSITRSVVAHDRNGHTASVGVEVLSPKTIGVSTTKYRFQRSSFAQIYVYGLPYRERVSIYFRGQLKASGTADAYGRFVRGIWTGRKLGKGTVHVYGQFGDIRKGTKQIKVVR